MAGLSAKAVVEMLMANCTAEHSDSLGGSWSEYCVAISPKILIRAAEKRALKTKLEAYVQTLIRQEETE